MKRKILTMALILLSAFALTACVGVRNQAPEISGVQSEVTIDQGDTFDPLDGVTATDDEDGDLTADIVVAGWTDGDEDVAGTYVITFTVTDAGDLSDTATMNLTVESETNATAPVITGVVTDVTYYIGSGDWNPLTNVTATDDIDGDITEDITVTGLYFLDAEGDYTVTLRVINSSGIQDSVIISLHVVESDVPTTVPTEDIEVTLWHAMGESNQALLQGYADDFNALYSNITVIIPSGAGDYDTLKSQMINQITAGDGLPNLVQGYPDHVAEYLNGNAVVPLNAYMTSANTEISLTGDDALDDIIQSYREENSQYDDAGTYYSLPFNKSTEVMIYNKTALDAIDADVPETWQDVMAMADDLKAYGDQIAEDKLLAENPTATPEEIQAAKDTIVPASYDSNGNEFITFTRQWAGAYTSINFETFEGNYLWNDNVNTVAAMQYLLDHKADMTIPDYWGEAYASAPFLNQQTFVTVGSSAGIRYNIPNAETDQFEIGVAPVPYNADLPDEKAAIQQGTNISIVNTGTPEEKLASWLFLKYLISTEVTVDWAMNTGYLPVRTSGYNSTMYQEFLNNPTTSQEPISLAANAAYAQKGYFFYDPAFIGSSRARNQVGAALARIILGDGDIDAALQEAFDEATLGA